MKRAIDGLAPSMPEGLDPDSLLPGSVTPSPVMRSQANDQGERPS